MIEKGNRCPLTYNQKCGSECAKIECVYWQDNECSYSGEIWYA